jgi:16S rRNA (guanine(966)-N(2))-methyltransferase RsmD
MSRSKPRKTTSRPPQSGLRGDGPQSVRIIGGTFRGRRLQYRGDPRTRPMKDRVREAVFNLVRESIEGRVALDLFAGTGVLGFEALSRGADATVLLERHAPTAKLMRANAGLLGVESHVDVIVTDTLS